MLQHYLFLTFTLWYVGVPPLLPLPNPLLPPGTPTSTPGSSFYVNYRVMRATTARETAFACLLDVNCLSFDHDGSAGWMHKITRACAEAAGGGCILFNPPIRRASPCL